MLQKNCLECGAPFTAQRAHAAFCCTAHRMDWNARRSDRGAELYDLVMSYTGQRVMTKEMLAEMQVLVSAYTQADMAKRGGRRSYQEWRRAKLSLPRVYGIEGDKR